MLDTLLDMDRKLLVTHHAPDLDAIGSIWLFKRFDAQHFATARVVFVNPGETASDQDRQGYIDTEVVHVDTGLGEFDHHQPDRGQLSICASTLVYDHLCKIHPDLKEDKALIALTQFINQVDHFGEIYWPEAGELRYCFMIHDLIYGREHLENNDDDSQLHFGMTCLDSAYAVLTEEIAAAEIIEQEGRPFQTATGSCLALSSANNATIKRAQKQGYQLVIRKDPHSGHIVIKARPDSEFVLADLSDAISQADTKGTWYYHPSGKMLLNGSRKHRNQTPSPLSLGQVIELVKQIYGKVE